MKELILLAILILSGCSYGNYYATGSYANQNNSDNRACGGERK